MRALTEATRVQKLAEVRACHKALTEAMEALCRTPNMHAVPGAVRWDRLFRTIRQLRHEALIRIEDLSGRGVE